MIAKIGGFKWIAFLLASTVVFGAAHPSGSGAKPAPALSSDAVRKHVYFLASDELAGRLPGTPGAEKAARYIADEFKRAGLKTLGKNWFQEFLFVAELKLGPSNRLQATVAGKPTAAKLTEDFLPLAFSASNPIEGEVVFAGFGITVTSVRTAPSSSNIERMACSSASAKLSASGSKCVVQLSSWTAHADQWFNSPMPRSNSGGQSS